MEVGSAAEAGIGKATGGKIVNDVLVDMGALTLVEGTLVPVEAQPLQVSKQQVGDLRVAGAGIQVLDAKDHLPACRAHGKPSHKGRENVAQVHAARRRGSKTADYLRHCSQLSA